MLYRDTMLPGFGLRAGAQSKVNVAEGQVNRRTRRVTIGREDVFAPEVARKKAMTILGDMAEGHDPNAEKRQDATKKVTLELALQRFLEVCTLSAYTVSHYQRTERLFLQVVAQKAG